MDVLRHAAVLLPIAAICGSACQSAGDVSLDPAVGGTTGGREGGGASTGTSGTSDEGSDTTGSQTSTGGGSGGGSECTDTVDLGNELPVVREDDLLYPPALDDAEHLLDGGCGGHGPELRYTWTAPHRGRFAFEVVATQSDFSPIVYILPPDCTNEALICSQWEHGASQARVEQELDEGETVVVVVDTFSQSERGRASLEIWDVEGCLRGAKESPFSGPFPQTVSGNTVGKGSLGAGCFETGPMANRTSPDESHVFVAPQDGTYSFYVSHGELDAIVAMGPECKIPMVGQIACGSVLDLERGERVVLTVDGNNDAGPYTLSVGTPSSCLFADLTEADSPVRGDTTGAPNDVPYNQAAERIYSWTPQRAGYYTLAADAVSTSSGTFEPNVSVTVGTCIDLLVGLVIPVGTFFEEGRTYAVIVGSDSPGEGVFDLSLEWVAACADLELSNDSPRVEDSSAGRPDLTASWYCAEGEGSPEVRHAYTAPVAGEYTFRVSGADFDHALYALEGQCGEEVDCSSGNSGATTTLDLSLAAGQSVTLVVDGAGAAAGGPYVLEVEGP